MVTIPVTCPRCASDAVQRYGRTLNGKQRYRCTARDRQFRENPQPNGYTPAEQTTILKAYQERSSLRGLTRTFGVSRTTVIGWIKKKSLSLTP